MLRENYCAAHRRNFGITVVANSRARASGIRCSPVMFAIDIAIIASTVKSGVVNAPFLKQKTQYSEFRPPSEFVAKLLVTVPAASLNSPSGIPQL